MEPRASIDRDVILQALASNLEARDFAKAFWEGGAVAFGSLDQWSDIDAYVVVDDGRSDDAFRAVEEILESLSGIERKYDIGITPWPGVYQAFYKLEGASQFHVVDLAVLEMSAPDKFLEPEIHGEVRFFFNKSAEIRPSQLDTGAFKEKMRKRLIRIRERLEIFSPVVQKEINRGHYIEAADAYRIIILDTLVEALRMLHNPFHYEFRTRYVHRELPSQTVNRLRELYFVRDEEDLEKKFQEGQEWARDTFAEIERSLGGSEPP